MSTHIRTWETCRGQPHHRAREVAVLSLVQDELSCATCKGNRGVGELEDNAGFCRDCLDRSRIVDDDEIGGES